MLTLTLDTNCLIDLEDEGRSGTPFVRQLIDLHDAGTVELAIVAVSASERQPDYSYLADYGLFREKADAAGLGHVPEILGLAYWGLAYWGKALHTSEESVAVERQIHNTMFPRIDFDWADYAARMRVGVDDLDARGPYGKWRRAWCDRNMFWAHQQACRNVFVTSDRHFSPLRDAPLLARIETPEGAIRLAMSEVV